MHDEEWMWDVNTLYVLATFWRCSYCMIIIVTNQIETTDQINMYAVQLTEINVSNIHMMCTSLLSCHWILIEVLRCKWRGHEVWLSHELLMEMKVAILYCFISGNSIQTGAVDDTEAIFFKYANSVASPSVNLTTLESYGR